MSQFSSSAGAALYAPGGIAEGVTGWESLRGKGVATIDGYYANEDLEGKYGARLVIVSDAQEAAKRIAAGEAVAFMDDSTNLRPGGGLRIIPAAPPINSRPYGIAVRKGEVALAGRLSAGLRELVSGGQDAPILTMENETFGAAGAPPNPDLQALVANPSAHSLLNP